MRLVLLADEVDADQPPDRAVRTVASHDVLRRDDVPSAHCTVTPSPSWVSPTTSAPRTTGTPRSSTRASQHLLGAALRDDQQHREPAGQLPQVQRRPAGRRDLVDRRPARQQLVGHPARVEQFQRAGVHRERPGDVGLSTALLEHPDSGAAERQLRGQHQPGRPGADHHHIAVSTRRDGSRIRPRRLAFSPSLHPADTPTIRSALLAVLFAHAVATAPAPLLVYRWGRKAFYPLALVPLGSLLWVARNWPGPGHARRSTCRGCLSCRWTSRCGSTRSRRS